MLVHVFGLCQNEGAHNLSLVHALSREFEYKHYAYLVPYCSFNITSPNCCEMPKWWAYVFCKYLCLAGPARFIQFCGFWHFSALLFVETFTSQRICESCGRTFEAEKRPGRIARVQGSNPSSAGSFCKILLLISMRGGKINDSLHAMAPLSVWYYIYTYVYTNASTKTHISTHMHTLVNMNRKAYTHMFIRMPARTRQPTHSHKQAHIHVHPHMVYKCTHAHTHMRIHMVHTASCSF